MVDLHYLFVYNLRPGLVSSERHNGGSPSIHIAFCTNRGGAEFRLYCAPVKFKTGGRHSP